VSALAIAALALFAPSVAVVPSTLAILIERVDAEGDVKALEKQLDDASEKRRREAVQSLAKLATPAAWELVVRALKDPAPMVADEAQLQLGALSDGASLAAALGKHGLASGDEWVRRRVAEALGRMVVPIEPAVLTALLRHKDPGLRRMAAWTLERRALAQHGRPEVDLGQRKAARVACDAAFASEKDPGVRAALYLASHAFAGDGSTLVADPPNPDEKSSELRCARLIAALRWPCEPKLEVVRPVLADPSYAVRAQAVETLASCRSKAACALLVERLEKETSLRLRWRIVAELQRLSGSDLELTPAYWKKWVDDLDDAWAPKTAEPSARKREAKVPEGTTVFLGLPVLSERLAILVDFSGSTWHKRESGKTRKETLDLELAKLLKQLTPATKFNVIPYTKSPIPWQKSLAPATSENVGKALDFFTKCKESGQGNVWDAIELAAKDPEVDTLIVLTDGAPTGGHRWNLELMEPLLAEHLRFQKIAVDAILVDASRFLQERWERITAATGGRMQAVEMR
jgi:HEAT repeat protein